MSITTGCGAPPSLAPGRSRLVGHDAASGGRSQTITAPDRRDLAARHVEYRQTRAPALLDELVRSYQGLVGSLARRLSRRGQDAEDVSQVCQIGLLKALERFDPDIGVTFATFAWATITGEVKRWHRDSSWRLRVPRSLQERYLHVAAAVDELGHELGRSPTINEIATFLGDTDEAVIEAIELSSARQPDSLDTSVREDGPDLPQLGCSDPNMATAEHRQTVQPLLDRLPERERRIVALRFEEDMTQAEIARALGISQMHVSRLLARSLGQMRAWAEESARIEVDLRDASLEEAWAPSRRASSGVGARRRG